MPSYEQAVRTAAEFLKSGKTQEGMHILDSLVAQYPGDAVALYLLGSGFLSGNADGAARVILEKAVEVRPDFSEAWHNLGVAYRKGEHYEKSREAYAKALEIDPGRIETMSMLAGTYVNAGDPEPGIEWAGKALALEPDEPHAVNHLAFCLLEAGRYREAWPHWAKRWRHPDRAKFARSYGASVPKWDGKPLDGTLVIHGEQGLGDEILYMSVMKQVKAKRIVIECAKPLVGLFKRTFGWPCYGCHQDLIDNEKQIDAWISMGDLLPLFAPDGPKERAGRYLKPSPAALKRDGQGSHPKVGIAWWGGLAQTHAKQRNPPLGEMKWLIDQLPNVNFISVQYNSEAVREEAELLGLPHDDAVARDFERLTALIDSCDIIVSVMQTAVHQAGALGKTCLVPTPTCTSWPFQLKGDMPWYQSVELYRQEDEWHPVFEQIAGRLRALTREIAA